MRWFWIDRFIEFTSGKQAIAVKNVSLSEEPIDEYNPGYPYYPASLIVEGIAQAGGILVAQIQDFQNRVVLAKVNKSEFHFPACPGNQLVFNVNILNLQESGAVVSGVSTVGDQTQCEVELVFAYLGDQFEGVELFEPGGFCRMLRCLKLFDVGKNEDGTSIQVPQHMLEAERHDIAKADVQYAKSELA